MADAASFAGVHIVAKCRPSRALPLSSSFDEILSLDVAVESKPDRDRQSDR